jgi:hypothetical protein
VFLPPLPPPGRTAFIVSFTVSIDVVDVVSDVASGVFELLKNT